MWARNLVFIGLCIGGLGAVGAGLFQRDKVQDPKSFQPAAYAQPEFRNVVDRVNREFETHWKEAGLTPAPRADDLTIARRMSLGLTGVIPSLEEVRGIEDLSDSLDATQRVQWWASRLLEDRRYADNIAERMARSYVGVENGPFLIYRRRRFVNWLSDRLFEKDASYDAIVRSLLADKGLWTDSPAVNFVTVTASEANQGQPDEIRLAGRTTRAFLGMRIDCLQCHDNNLPREVLLGADTDPHDGLQSDFHQLAAFFSEAKSSLTGVKDGKDEYQYKYLHEEAEEVVPPIVPYGQEMLPTQGTRRERLAGWVTHPKNKPFARAAVNRMWAFLFGRPLVQPIDDIPLYGFEEGDERRWWTSGGNFPPGMEALADDFIENGFDLARLVRIIAATDVFQADSRTDFEITAEHEKHWAVFPLTRLRPEQVAGALIQSSSLDTIDAQSHIIFQLSRYAQQNNFIQRYGDTGEDEFTERAGTIPQRLLMMNGELISERTKSDISNASARIANLSPSNEKAIETVYLTILSRRPSNREMEVFKTRLGSVGRQRRFQHIEDLYWVLLNSTEFSWNH